MRALDAVSDVVSEARQIQTISHTRLFARAMLHEPHLLEKKVRAFNYEALKEYLVDFGKRHLMYEELSKKEITRMCLHRKMTIRGLNKFQLIERLRLYDRQTET
jgi:hypothetical protein